VKRCSTTKAQKYGRFLSLALEITIFASGALIPGRLLPQNPKSMGASLASGIQARGNSQTFAAIGIF
jgi:hypothetical protein